MEQKTIQRCKISGCKSRQYRRNAYDRKPWTRITVSQCGFVERIALLSDLTDTDAGDTMRLQAEGVLKKVDVMLQTHGPVLDHILRAEIFIRNQADVTTFNEAWDQWINRNMAPARYLAVSGFIGNQFRSKSF